jgi:hypothetical protein
MDVLGLFVAGLGEHLGHAKAKALAFGQSRNERLRKHVHRCLHCAVRRVSGLALSLV